MKLADMKKAQVSKSVEEVLVYPTNEYESPRQYRRERFTYSPVCLKITSFLLRES
ncbi:hypothetical protein SAMN05192529_11774 [Arachidicoccus rhizosphaerae]|uniref:Uncharacterized protein n=1 Tax=Arachidicoccus rhizosphaerae TaxID=551991 RepID=A0A1H4B0J7_9BACT|nr:hypothetical protein SAMN05192529_11774 [Arachidicoccus rhizosphaerae]